MLFKRNLDLINDIYARTYNINELANKYNISERMLRYDVNEINQIFMKYFDKTFIEIKNSNITTLITKEMCNSLILKLPIDVYGLSSVEREYLIILDILLFTNKFKLQEISEAYLVSKGTIRHALKNIHLQFLKYKIYLKVSSSIDKGYKLIAKELDIRKFLINHIREGEIQNENNPFIKKLIQSKIDKFSFIFDINQSKNEILKLLNQNELSINDEAFEIISYYLYLSKNRNYGGFYIDNDSIDNKLFLTNTKEYEYIKTNINAENLCENDVLVITDFFIGLYNFNKNYSFFANWVHIEQLVFNILKKLSKEFNVDFTKDRILINEFLHHIKPAIYRMRNKLKLSESIVGQVIQLYPNIYFSVKKVMEHLKEIVTIELDDDEISFITIMIKRALKRNSKTKRYKNPKVLIVCGFGYSSSKLISENLSENFYVDIVDTIPYNKLQRYENIKDIDLIITTLDFHLQTHDIIKVNAIFTEKDIHNLIEYGLVKRNIKISEKDLIDFIDHNRNCSTKELKLKIRKKFGGYIQEEPEEQNYKKIF